MSETVEMILSDALDTMRISVPLDSPKAYKRTQWTYQGNPIFIGSSDSLIGINVAVDVAICRLVAARDHERKAYNVKGVVTHRRSRASATEREAALRTYAPFRLDYETAVKEFAVALASAELVEHVHHYVSDDVEDSLDGGFAGHHD